MKYAFAVAVAAFFGLFASAAMADAKKDMCPQDRMPMMNVDPPCKWGPYQYEFIRRKREDLARELAAKQPQPLAVKITASAKEPAVETPAKVSPNVFILGYFTQDHGIKAGDSDAPGDGSGIDLHGAIKDDSGAWLARAGMRLITAQFNYTCLANGRTREERSQCSNDAHELVFSLGRTFELGNGWSATLGGSAINRGDFQSEITAAKSIVLHGGGTFGERPEAPGKGWHAEGEARLDYGTTFPQWAWPNGAVPYGTATAFTRCGGLYCDFGGEMRLGVTTGTQAPKAMISGMMMPPVGQTAAFLGAGYRRVVRDTLVGRDVNPNQFQLTAGIAYAPEWLRGTVIGGETRFMMTPQRLGAPESATGYFGAYVGGSW